jgi:tryptophan synthase alpha chain
MKKLVAYLTSGCPDVEFTKDLIESMRPHTDIFELGVPFSDPVADGAVIEKANYLALQKGVDFSKVLEIAKSTEADTLLMGYFNSFYNFGVDRLFTELPKNSVSGTIIPDLPFEESRRYMAKFQESGLANIPFIAPTDSRERIKQVLREDSHKFIYLVAYAGITGTDKSEDLDEVIQNIRAENSSPLYIGFGVNRESATEKARGVDGVIVGSEFVKVLLNESLSNSQKIDEITAIAKEIKEKINL